MTDTATPDAPEAVSRFGFTEAEWEEFQDLYAMMDGDKLQKREDDGMVFFDWEAEQLRKIFEEFKGRDPHVCAVLARMMWYVNDRNFHTGAPR